MTTTTPTKSPFQTILDTVPEADRAWVSLEAMRYWNCCGGRPSDAARSIVRDYESGYLTHEKFLAERGR